MATCLKILSRKDLAGKGIPYSRQHLSRLIEAGTFPKPFKMGGAENGPNSWTENEIDQYIAAQISKRDAKVSR